MPAVPPAPSPTTVWQSGYWGWSDVRYVWTPGHYVQRPTLTASWIPGYWRRGPSGWMWGRRPLGLARQD